MAQAGDSLAESAELSQEAVTQLNNFHALLVELRILDLPANPNLQTEPDAATPTASEALLQPVMPSVDRSDVMAEALNQPDCLPALELPRLEQAETAIALIAAMIEPAVPPALPDSPNCTDISETEQLADSEAAMQQLQALLVPPELTAMRQVNADLSNKLGKLEYQLYKPEELMKLLLPLVAELLNRKVTESQEDMVKAIAPIIDSVIQSRSKQQDNHMGSAIAPVLASAMAQQTHDSPDEMALALAPAIGQAIKKQIELEQGVVIDALYPIIGGTISKYLSETIQSINRQIEESLSSKGIQRKIRAKLQGVSEAELILQEAMPFTVQAIFLVHKESGLVIAEVQRADDHRLESEMVAGMLTAIRSFVNDCIARSGSLSELDEIDYGTSKIILEAAGYGYLAVVVQGEPSKLFIAKLRRTLSTLVKQYCDVIEAFEGDPEMVPKAVPTLLETLRDADDQSQSQSARKGLSPVMLIGLGILGAIALPLGILQHFASINHQAEADSLQALNTTPELGVYQLTVAADRGLFSRGTLKLSGKLPNPMLRQKAEQVVKTAAPSWAIANRIVAVDIPPDPVLAAAEVNRVTATLNRMEGATIASRFANGALWVEGTVSRREDAIAITQALARIPGVRSVSNTVQVRPLTLAVQFYFQPSSADIVPADLGYKLNEAIAFLQQHPEQQLRIIGYSNPTHEPTDPALALARATAIQTELLRRGIAPNRLHLSGVPTFPPNVDATQPTWLSRCVRLEVNPSSYRFPPANSPT